MYGVQLELYEIQPLIPIAIVECNSWNLQLVQLKVIYQGQPKVERGVAGASSYSISRRLSCPKNICISRTTIARLSNVTHLLMTKVRHTATLLFSKEFYEDMTIRLCC